MRAFSFREYIDRPVQQVWDALIDLPQASRWRPLIKTMETEDGQPLNAGSRVKITVEFLGRTSSRVSTTVAFEPYRQWTVHSSDAPTMEGWFDFQLEAKGAGTQVLATCDLKAHGFLPRLFLPLIARGERTRRVEMLPNLKRFVETRG
jgi:carbon monoxide dehydrogenase subunit G